jgi:cyclopropane fatty-acyl-phospholipid synthase-like methyltransferase
VAKLTDHIVFNDPKLAAKYANGKIPMSTLFEAYFDGALDIPGDLDKFLDHRDELVTYNLTMDHVKQFFTHMIPEVAIHSKAQDERIVRDHYDRGNDFFGWFLGERMVYTSGFFLKGPTDESLEQAQDQKMDLVCNKLMLQPGESLLDVGCGWGTLARHAAKNFGADATGITIAQKQTEFGNERIRQWNLQERARILCLDYRDIPRRKFDKISSLEMVEHVGVKNYQKFCNLMYELLNDKGLFLMQFCGLRRGGKDGVAPANLRPEDMIWGLFMNKYIFPGADASLPPSDMLKGLEKAGFEIHSVENISIHYSHTIAKWHKNWIANKADILRAYGDRWYRIWHFFLGWSTRIGAQGNSACFQVVAHKNLDTFDRNQFITQPALGQQRGMFDEKVAAQGTKSRNGKHAEA